MALAWGLASMGKKKLLNGGGKALKNTHAKFLTSYITNIYVISQDGGVGSQWVIKYQSQLLLGYTFLLTFDIIN